MSWGLPASGQFAATSRERVDFPAPARPSMRMTGLAAATSTTAAMISEAARCSACATGSLFLDRTDDARECATGDTDERYPHCQQRDDVGLEAQPFFATNVHAERDRHTAAATAAVVILIGDAAGSGPGHGDGIDVTPVHSL